MSDFSSRLAALPPDKQRQLARLVERDGGVGDAFQVSLAHFQRG
jgi:hypothetical protein